MKRICILLLVTVVCSVQARTTQNLLDLQAHFLRHLCQAAKARPQVNDEINLSPDGNEVANMVRSIAGKAGKLTLCPEVLTQICIVVML